MLKEELAPKASEYLTHLCIEIPNRRLGTEGNRKATRFFQTVMDAFDFSIESQQFECMAMKQGEIRLSADRQSFEAFISPHSLGCDLAGTLVHAATVNDLESLDAEGKILLLSGEITREQLMPKGFVFYNPEEHQKIYRLLEERAPAAVITATGRNPDAVGAIYPFPMIEDGDFEIPVAFMTDEEGSKLASYLGDTVSLFMDSERIYSHGENIVARKADDREKKVVVCAHIDTKENTPGALDNASGVVILLLLAELLKDYSGNLGVELVALNGEEYYNTPGQNLYLDQAKGTFDQVLLAVNLDDIGYHKDRSAYSLYGVPEQTANIVNYVYADRDDFFEGPQWYQSDHGIFIANGIPAMAITEESFAELLREITHSEKDTPDIVDPKKLAENAIALRDLIFALESAKN